MIIISHYPKRFKHIILMLFAFRTFIVLAMNEILILT